MINNTNITLKDNRQYCSAWRTSQLYLSYQRLLEASCHMDDTIALDTRILYLTITFRYGKPAELLKPLYHKICLGLTGSAYPKGTNRPGMVIHEDAAGSRYGSAHDFNRHVHALIVLPHQTNNDGMGISVIAKELELQLNTNLRLRETREAKVIAYDFGDHAGDHSLAGLDDYNNKLVRKAHGEGFNRCLVSAIYPAKLDRNNPKTSRSKVTSLNKRYDQLLRRLHNHPRSIFSERYLHTFGEELLALIRAVQPRPINTKIIQQPANDNNSPFVEVIG